MAPKSPTSTSLRKDARITTSMPKARLLTPTDGVIPNSSSNPSTVDDDRRIALMAMIELVCKHTRAKNAFGDRPWVGGPVLRHCTVSKSRPRRQSTPWCASNIETEHDQCCNCTSSTNTPNTIIEAQNGRSASNMIKRTETKSNREARQIQNQHAFSWGQPWHNQVQPHRYLR